MEFEWDVDKAEANKKKHGVSFEDAVLVFTDPNAITFSDPDHLIAEAREITIGKSHKWLILLVSHTERPGKSESFLLERRPRARPSCMSDKDKLRSDYGDLLKDGIRGKYYEQCQDGAIAILLDKDVAEVFKDGKQVNEILRALIPAVKPQAS